MWFAGYQAWERFAAPCVAYLLVQDGKKAGLIPELMDGIGGVVQVGPSAWASTPGMGIGLHCFKDADNAAAKPSTGNQGRGRDLGAA